MSRLEWNGDEANVYIRGRTLSALMVLAQAGENRARELISIPGPPRSSPGSPPHVDTGALRDSVTHEVDAGQMAARIGTSLDYGLYLEVGTSRMAARPWLRRAVMEISSRADQILTAGMSDDKAGTSVISKVIGGARRVASRIAGLFRGRK